MNKVIDYLETEIKETREALRLCENSHARAQYEGYLAALLNTLEYIKSVEPVNQHFQVETFETRNGWGWCVRENGLTLERCGVGASYTNSPAARKGGIDWLKKHLGDE